ncbi:carbon monoxide dehydrogenase [Sulfolobus sp. E5-1-F]|uniref:SRPBCC domain-containing protein n=1 Tax=Sulfolobaceae TaxID=118883 RepID=UPI00129747FA|nr:MULTISPECIES: CoxG family protein [unclassified Sulfolobus]QGA53658.1 carbon monoxide dehydrogenase [Sulfolobus sp. E5-1-F]QGA68685.1 carbon monoxide dehydrogenase [Sulfolobus sp. E11-6]
MDFKGIFDVKKKTNVVKEFLINPKQFAECLPGLQSYEIANNTFKASFKLDVSQMKIPHMSTLTALINANILEKENNIKISGNGRSAGVGIKFNITMALEEVGEITRVNWLAKVDLGMLSKLLGEENIRRIAEPNITHIINCISSKLS